MISLRKEGKLTILTKQQMGMFRTYPKGHEWAVDGPDQLGSRHAKDAGATVQIEGHVQEMLK